MQRQLSPSILALFATAIFNGSLFAQEAATQTKEQPAASTTQQPAAAVQPPLVKLEDISKSVGKEVLVEFTVKNGKLLDDKKICFLNSLKNYRDKKNFTVVIKSDTLELFARAKIADPPKHYLGKKIRVRGKVVEHRSTPQSVVTKVDQIKILATPAAKDNSPKDNSPKDAKVATAGEETTTE